MPTLSQLVGANPYTSNLTVLELPDGEFMARFRVIAPGSSTAQHVYGFGRTSEGAKADAKEWFNE